MEAYPSLKPWFDDIKKTVEKLTQMSNECNDLNDLEAKK